MTGWRVWPAWPCRPGLGWVRVGPGAAPTESDAKNKSNHASHPSSVARTAGNSVPATPRPVDRGWPGSAADFPCGYCRGGFEGRPSLADSESGQAGRVRAWQQYQATELASESGPVGGPGPLGGILSGIPKFQPGDPARVGIMGLTLLKWGIMFKILPVPVTQPVRHWPGWHRGRPAWPGRPGRAGMIA